MSLVYALPRLQYENRLMFPLGLWSKIALRCRRAGDASHGGFSFVAVHLCEAFHL